VRALERGERRRAVQARDAAETPGAVGGFMRAGVGSNIGMLLLDQNLLVL